MSRLTLTLALVIFFTSAVQASELALAGFNKRFTLVKNAQGKVTAIKLKQAVTHFTIMPFIEQIKADLQREQQSFNALTSAQKEAEIDDLLMDLGMNPYFMAEEGAEEAQALKDAIMSVRDADLEGAFRELKQIGFWKEFEQKLNEAFLFIDPTVLANLEDSRFFYKRMVTYKVVNWALDQAKKRFSHLPILNIASFVIVRVHAMMLDQRHFHHNMLLHYFETIPESKLGMTKEEVDRAVSSIYEYRIDLANVPESNRAARDWLNYGMNNFYTQVRAGNAKIKSWSSGMSNMNFQDIKKINFGFAEVKEGGVKKIYHLHNNAHFFSKKPSLAYDYSSPNRVKRNRALLNIGGIALGFIQLPGWLKGSVMNFMESFYVEQVRLEGALIGHFESTNNVDMINRIYAQRANFYILK